MAVQNTQYENLVSAFSKDYLGKLYYYCLKKTSNAVEAEDLSSDITLNVLTELQKGTLPASFSAWVWKIASNRYSVWVDKKNKNGKRFFGGSIEEHDPMDDKLIESEFVHGEDLRLLRRELSFISKDYREIVVAFYIEDLKVQTIAKTLGLPEGTVSSKLFRARNILKEGMNMAREFGARSYKPENVNFAASGDQPSGLPWKAVQRKLPKNILLQAHNNSSTLEELSVEIGIAAPYMEEEVQLLVDGELLLETNGKYITNFYIACKECQLEIYNAQRKKAKEISVILDEIITPNLPAIRKIINAGESISDNELKWLITSLTLDSVNNSSEEKQTCNSFKYERKDGGNWGFTGFEEHNLIPEVTETWQNGNTGGGKDGKVEFWRYSYPAHNIGLDASRLGYNQSFLFEDIVINNRRVNSFTEDEKRIWKDIDGWYAHADENGKIFFDVPVLKGDNIKEMREIMQSNAGEKFEKLYAFSDELFIEVKEILKKYGNPLIENQINYYTSTFMWNVRGMVINDAVEAKRLIAPEETVKSKIGLYVNVNLTP